MPSRLWRFPVPAAVKKTIKDSFGRVYIPGTNRRYARGRHAATDLAGTNLYRGKSCVAVWDGTVRLRSFGKAFGNQVTVVRVDGVGAFYAHLSSFNVSDGQQVKAGQTIGTVGRSGMKKDEPHLHFEIRRDWRNWNTAEDPYPELIRLQRAALK